jgi:hypothetical protein
MTDRLTTVFSYALWSLFEPRQKTTTSIQRWAEIEFGKESNFAIEFYHRHKTFPSEHNFR